MNLLADPAVSGGEVALSLLGILVGLAILTYLIMRGVNIFIVAITCALIVSITGGIDPYVGLKEHYMTGFVNFFRANFLIFLTGTLMGKIMEITNGAKAIARLIVSLLGKDKALISIPLACGIIGYGGVSVFVISFAVFPIALEVFKEADLPRRFIPAALTFGCSTFAMVAPGAPQIHNSIPANELGTDLMAGALVGYVSCGAMLVIGCLWLFQIVGKAKKQGEHFVAKPMDVFKGEENLPSGILALIPLIVTVVIINVKIGGKTLVPLEVGVFIGALLVYILLNKHQDNKKIFFHLGEGCKNAVGSIANTCAVVGFGAVVQQANAFNSIIKAMVSIPGPELVGVALGTTVIAGICGSASGGLGIAAPLLGPAYLARGLSAQMIHRTMSISSAALDSLPHNGYIVTVTNGICNETHKDAYGAVFKLTVVVPFIASIICVVLFTIFPV